MKKYFYLMVVLVLVFVSCSQMDLPEKEVMSVVPEHEASDWSVERVYFMDRGNRMIARVNREDLGGEWYFYRSIDKGEQVMMSAISDQLFRKDVSEYPCITSTFKFADDVYRIHRYDGKQSRYSQYYFLIISKKK